AAHDDELDEDDDRAQSSEGFVSVTIPTDFPEMRFNPLGVSRAIGPEWGREIPNERGFAPASEPFDFTAHVDETRDKVIDTITYELACMGGFSMDETLATLGADDLDAAKVLIGLEQKFELGHGGIDDHEITKDSTVNDILSVVLKKLG
ncbi:MAG: hypothetical protein DI537_48755, partial [Stutzerimonas stutzeri]